MADHVNPIPYPDQNIIPYIIAEDVSRLLEFLRSAFDAQLTYKLERADGSIMHAEVKIGSNRIMMGEPTEQFGAASVNLHVCRRQ